MHITEATSLQLGEKNFQKTFQAFHSRQPLRHSGKRQWRPRAQAAQVHKAPNARQLGAHLIFAEVSIRKRRGVWVKHWGKHIKKRHSQKFSKLKLYQYNKSKIIRKNIKDYHILPHSFHKITSTYHFHYLIHFSKSSVPTISLPHSFSQNHHSQFITPPFIFTKSSQLIMSSSRSFH